LQPKPIIGRIVHYRLTAEQARIINSRRVVSVFHGNWASADQVCPMIVTAIWPLKYVDGARLAIHAEGGAYESSVGVNGQVLLDGNDSLWVTSAPHHRELHGCWFWPPRED